MKQMPREREFSWGPPWFIRRLVYAYQGSAWPLVGNGQPQQSSMTGVSNFRPQIISVRHGNCSQGVRVAFNA
jgi:hypothetical protein